MLALVLTFLRRGGVDSSKIKFWLNIHESNNPALAKQYWSSILNISNDVISVTTIPNKGQSSKYPNGVLRISVYDTILRSRVGGWIDRMKQYSTTTFQDKWYL